MKKPWVPIVGQLARVPFIMGTLTAQVSMGEVAEILGDIAVVKVQYGNSKVHRLPFKISTLQNPGTRAKRIHLS